MSVEILHPYSQQAPQQFQPDFSFTRMHPDGINEHVQAVMPSTSAEAVSPYGIPLGVPRQAARPTVEQRVIPDHVTDGIEDATLRLAAMGRYIDNDPGSQIRFKIARRQEIETAKQHRAEWREQRVKSVTTAGAVAVGGLRRAARWVHTRHVATKHAVKNAAQATAAYIS